MKIRVTISSSMNEAIVVLEPNWFDRLLVREPREFMALRSPSITGGLRWWDDARRAPVRDRRVLAELDYAYWKADRSEYIGLALSVVERRKRPPRAGCTARLRHRADQAADRRRASRAPRVPSTEYRVATELGAAGLRIVEENKR